MKEIDIEGLLAAMEKPSTKDSMASILEMLGKADDVLKQVETVMTRLDRMGLKPLLVRGLSKQLGVDGETPLISEGGFKSKIHEQYINTVNKLSEEELKKQLEGAKGEN